jgi:uncharacterized cupin superfamily protein
MVPESQLESTEYGLIPKGEGWFVLNARDAPWWNRQGRGVLCEFETYEETGQDFHQFGINLTILGPGEPMAMYHRENDQEDFLVLDGEALAIVEGEERPLRQWDLLHCPAGTEHVVVGAGDGPCVILAVGARTLSAGPDWGAYTVDETALRHDAGVEQETTDAGEAYARFPKGSVTRYGGWLPG